MAVREAAIALLLDEGLGGFTLDKVSKRAEVNRTTLYRRWGSRERLLTWALLEHQRVTIPQPDTGSLDKDLVALALSLGQEVAGPLGAMFATLFADHRARDPEIDAALKDFWTERDRLAGEILQRGIDRGDIGENVDGGLLLEMLFGTVYFRILRGGKAPSREAVERLVAHVLAQH